MSGTEHQATVDKGLKMKIKRTKNVGPSSGGNSGVSGNKNDSKHEVIKSSSSDKSSHSSADFHTSNANGTSSSSATDKTKSSLMNSDKDKSPKVKGVHRKDKMKEKVGKGAGEPATSSSSLFSVSTSLDAAFSQVSLEPKHGEVANSNKKDNPLPDPYEFNAKEEDGFGLPVKKMKVEKLEPSAPVSSSTISQTVCVGTDMCSVGVATEPECLGPCEPGTSVNLEGIVWHETENGMLVVNVTWRGKTYVGTLLDATKHDWAPPRLNCDSPISDFETRTPKGRAKRGRGATSTPVNERDMRKLRKGRRGSNTFQAPPSPAKSDISTGSGIKRKSRPPDIDLSVNDSGRSSKRSRSCSRGTPGTESPVLGLIECPEPNCNKKYKHMNGLRYHQSHAHQGAGLGGEEIDDELRDNEDSILDELDSTTVDSCDIGNNAAKDAEISDMDGEKKMEEEEESNVDNSEEMSKSVRSNSPVKVTPVIGQKKDAFVTNSNTIATNSASKSLNVSGHVFQVVSHHSTTANVTAPIQTQTMSSTTLPMTVSQQVPITATVVASCSVQITMPITVTAMSTVSQSIESKSDTLKSDKSGDKSRSQKPGNRPIMPSHMIALSSSVSVTQSNVGPVTTPSSNVSQLKPIQPKPASMKTDSKNTNSPFAGLKELKRKEMKEKKRQREMMSGTSGSSPATSLPKTGTPKPEHPKEQSSVIKVTPIAPKPMESNTNRLDINVRKSDIDKPTSNVGMTAVVQPLNKGIDLSTQRQVEPPSVLKVSSPLSITATDTCKSNINDDVQSPAYSDISDANEAASPAAPQSADSPQKNKDNVQLSNKNKDLPNSATDQNSKESNPVSQFGMYGPYYGQQPYLLSSLSPSAQGSQSMNSPKMPTSAKNQNSEQAKLQNSDLKLKRESSKDDKREDVDNKQDPSRSLSEQEYQHMQHQKWVQQQMYALQSLPPHAQYDYFAAYGPYLDPAYHMHLMSTNLQYRQHFEKVMEEQKRMQPPPSEGGARKEMDGVPNRPVDRPGEHPSSSTVSATTTSSDSNVVSDDSQQGKASTYLDISYSSRDGRDGDKKRHSVDSMVDRDMNKDRAIREKQNENHQILKENIDLKAQMDRCHPYEQNFDPFRMSASRDKTSEEQARRLQMYQQQKMIEHQKREEQKKLDGNKSEHRPDMSGKTSSSVDKLRDHSGEGASRLEPSKKDLENKNKDMPINVNNIKTEPGEPKSGSSSDKTRTPSSERGRSVETPDRARSIENPSTERVRGLSDTPKSKPGLVNKASSPTPSMSASVTPYLQYPSYQYMQSPPYGQMPYEPGHPMYHGINPALNPAMMYPGAYLHPSQLGYRVGSAVEVDDKDKLAGSSSSKKLMMDDEKSKLSSSADSPIHGSHYYGSGHKIHELQEKRLSSPHRSSPVPSKGGDSQPPTPTSLPSKVADKNREFSSSPPTQRHVHTHHHTHVLETAYPVYPLSTMFPGTPQQTTSPSLQHPTFPPGK